MSSNLKTIEAIHKAEKASEQALEAAERENTRVIESARRKSREVLAETKKQLQEERAQALTEARKRVAVEKEKMDQSFERERLQLRKTAGGKSKPTVAFIVKQFRRALDHVAR